MQSAEVMGDDASRLKRFEEGKEGSGWLGCVQDRTGQGGLASDTFIIDQLRGNKHAH